MILIIWTGQKRTNGEGEGFAKKIIVVVCTSASTSSTLLRLFQSHLCENSIVKKTLSRNNGALGRCVKMQGLVSGGNETDRERDNQSKQRGEAG